MGYQYGCDDLNLTLPGQRVVGIHRYHRYHRYPPPEGGALSEGGWVSVISVVSGWCYLPSVLATFDKEITNDHPIATRICIFIREVIKKLGKSGLIWGYFAVL